MGIFFRFGNPYLLQSGTGNNLPKRIGHIVLIEDNPHSLEGVIITGHGIILQRQRLHAQFRHIFLGQHHSNLTKPVRTVIDTDDHIPLLNQSYRTTVLGNHHREYELIGYLRSIGSTDCFHSILKSGSLTGNKQVIGLLHPFPAFVPIHGIVPANHRGDAGGRFLEVFCKSRHKALSAPGVRIPAIGDGVDKHLLKSEIGSHIAKFVHMRVHGMYPAVGDQTNQMNGFTLIPGIRKCLRQGRILSNAAIFTGQIDLDQILIEDSSGTYVEVSYLGVSHHSVGESHAAATSQQLGMWIRGRKCVHIGGMSLKDDVRGSVVPDTPAIQDHEQYFFDIVCHDINFGRKYKIQAKSPKLRAKISFHDTPHGAGVFSLWDSSRKHVGLYLNLSYCRP